jgi:hypothetical protein
MGFRVASCGFVDRYGSEILFVERQRLTGGQLLPRVRFTFCPD